MIQNLFLTKRFHLFWNGRPACFHHPPRSKKPASQFAQGEIRAGHTRAGNGAGSSLRLVRYRSPPGPRWRTRVPTPRRLPLFIARMRGNALSPPTPRARTPAPSARRAWVEGRISRRAFASIDPSRLPRSLW